MPPIAFIPLLVYAVISSFTPGPATLSTSSVGLRHGFRRSLRYQAGLAVGVFIMMLLGGLLSAGLLAGFPAIEPVLRWVGAAYLLYLAYTLLRAEYALKDQAAPPLGFGHGLVLNLSNPKLVVYALSVFTTFLAPLAGRLGWVMLAALALAAVSAAATVTWTVFGASLQALLRRPRAARWVNAALALCLLYAAVELTGLIPALG